jgi:hypothetical protein
VGGVRSGPLRGDSVTTIPIEQLASLIKKPSKYRAQPVVVDGIRFHSRKEANRWVVLKLLAERGAITNLRRQVPYELTLKTTYVADFVYDDGAGEVVEDVKGFRTKVYRQKYRAMLAQHGIRIKES